nr:PREDICTED: uncharacterized protein LOC105664373 [Megachile rotundata]
MDRSNFPDSSSSITGETSEKSPLFKLYFSKDQLLGRSNVRPFKIEGTRELFRKHLLNNHTYESIVDVKIRFRRSRRAKILLREIRESRGRVYEREQGFDFLFKKRKRRKVHFRYGWWHEQGIQPIESRINFRKRTSDLVNFRMKIYAEDEKLKTLK